MVDATISIRAAEFWTNNCRELLARSRRGAVYLDTKERATVGRPAPTLATLLLKLGGATAEPVLNVVD